MKNDFVKIIVILWSLLFNNSGIKGQGFDKMVDNLINGSVPLIYPDSLNEIMRNGKKFILLDAREPAEYKTSHIPNAANIGYKKFDISNIRADKNDEIIVYCSVGYRSEKIGEKLEHAGYRHVYNLHGGIFDWKNKGYPVVDTASHKTDQVHGYSPDWGKWLLNAEIIYD